jgi:ADP-ribose pyrophosphatase YjhB (NUDIX family)
LVPTKSHQLEPPLPAVRLAVKAIIIRDHALLVLKNLDKQGEWYMLPGGGQEHGETIPDALRRECREEIGAEVSVGILCFVRDYIGRNHEFADEGDNAHQVELMFACELLSEPGLGSNPDSMQIGIAWLNLHDLAHFRIYPRVLQHLLATELPIAGPVYLGDVN